MSDIVFQESPEIYQIIEVAEQGPSGPFSFTDVPAAADSTGTTGQVAQDGDFLYVCISENCWKRTALTTWGIPT